MLDINDLYRERDSLHAHGGNVARMLEAYRKGDRSFTPAVRRMTLSATRNVLEAYLQTLNEVEAEVLPKPSVSSRLPAVASVGSL